MARLGAARRGSARRGKARLGSARLGMARQGKARFFIMAKAKIPFQQVRPPFKASAERTRLIERMLEVKIGGHLTYREITTIIGEGAQTPRGLAIIRSAKKVLRNEHSRVFVNLRNEGVKRLNDDEIIDHAATVVVTVRRKVKVGAREMQCVSYAELPMERRTDYHLNRTVLHYIHSMVNNESLKNVRALVAAQSESPQVGNVLQLFHAAG
jgi:hypothetical protein